MDKDDIEKIDMVVNSHKVRYDNLDCSFGESILDSKIYAAINITEIITDLNMVNAGLNSNDLDFDLHCAISIMNLFAHYKHYYNTRKVRECIIIGYVDTNKFFEENSLILKKVLSLCLFFKNVYLIPNVKIKQYVAFTVETMIYCLESSSIPIRLNNCEIHVYSKRVIDKQLLLTMPCKNSYRIFKPYANGKVNIQSKTEMLTTHLKGEFYNDSIYKSEIETCFVPICRLLGTLNYDNFDRFKIKSNVRGVPKKLENVSNILSTINIDMNENVTSKDKINMFINRLITDNVINEEYIDSFKKYCSLYDYRYQNFNELYTIVNSLLISWKAKIKDYKMIDESEQYKLLIDHPMYTNWLL